MSEPASNNADPTPIGGEERPGSRTDEFEALLEHAPIGLCYFDRQHRYLRINDQLAATNGRPAAEHIGKTFEEMRPEVASQLGALIDQIFATGESVESIEVSGEIPGRPGDVRHWLSSYFPVRGTDGAVAAVGGWVIDVTDKRRVEAELRTNEERLRLACEVGGIGAWEIDLDTGKVIESREIAAMYGLPAGQTNRHLRETRARAHPDDLPGIETAVRAAIETGELYSIEHRIVRDDGTTGWITTRGRALRDPDGRPTRAIGVTRETTAEKQATESLSASELRLRNVLDGIAEGFALLDADFTILAVNREGLRLNAMTADQLIGRSHWDVFPDTENSELGRLYKKAMHERVPVSLAHRYMFADGHTLWLDMRAYPSGEDQLALFWRDVTDRKEAEEALKASEERLRRATRAGRMFVWETDVKAGTISWGQGAADLLGVAEDKLPHDMAQGVFFVSEGDRDRLQGEFEAAVARGDLSHCAEFTGIDGRAWQADSSINYAADGTVAGVIGITQDVTERPAVAQALAKSEARLDQILQLTPVGIVEFDRDGIFTYANSAAERIIGLSRAQMEARGIDTAIWRIETPEGAPIAADTLPGARALRGETIYGFEHALIDGRGKRRIVSVDAQLLPSGAGGLATIVDVTERHRADAALKEVRQRLDAILDNASVAVFLMDDRQHCQYMNRAAEAMSGYSFAETQGRPLHDVVHHSYPDGRPFPLAECAIDRAFPENAQTMGEEVFVHKDGSFYPVAFVASPVRDERAKTIGTVIEVRDITEEKRIERELRESEARYRAVFEQAGVGVARVSLDGPFIEVNDRYCEILGRPRGDLMGAGWKEITHPDDLGGDVANVERLLAGEADSFQMEKRYIRPDGSSIWVDMTVALTRNIDGTPAFFVAVAQDIEARKRAERALEELNRNLEIRVEERTATLAETAKALETEMSRREAVQAQLVQAQKMEALGQLVGGVAHDFNNILAAIQAAFALLDRKVDGDMKFVVAEGRKAGERATKLIRQMLAFARRERLQTDIVDLRTALPEAREMLAHAVGTLVDCSVEVVPGTWPVLVDRQQLEVALLNLAVNARDAMPGGGGLTIAARNLGSSDTRPPELGSGDHIVIEVRDTGTGMDQATAARVFEPFFTTKATGKGTGLGLAQVHGVVAAAGGAITVRSEPGTGTAFMMYLPRSAIVDKPADAPSRSADDHARATLLLVDDDDQVRPVTAAFLRDLGHTVVEADSAAVALAMAELHPVDLLLTDVIMPGTDGPALVRQMRALRPGLPAVYVTGFAGERKLDDAPVLLKPFSAEELEAVIAKMLGD